IIKVIVRCSSWFCLFKKKKKKDVRKLECNDIEFQEVKICMLENKKTWAFKKLPPQSLPAQ
uniref:Uncharacterized protein n=1 Tax=Macaca mulatta TaxID=9544 RepID=A0A5F7ZL19_MACMU